jgi:hypothetical protein
MRHAFGFLLGVLLTPGLAYGAAWGWVETSGSFDPVAREITDDTRLYGGFAVLAAIGLVMGIVVVAQWISPLASLIPALALVGWSVYFFVDPDRALLLPSDAPPAGSLDAGLQMLLGSGVFALIGFALLVPMGAPRRWRRDRAEPREYAPEREPEYY